MENYLDMLKEAQLQLTSRNKTVAVKDLTMCHRKKVFSIFDPVPMTEGELYDYISGQAAHDIIERLFMMQPTRFRSEKEIQYCNIKGKIDIHDKLLNNVIDIKNSKSQQTLLKPFKFHEEQVRYYMAMVDSEEGQVIYQMNNFGRYLPFPVYMTAEQRKEQLQKLEYQSKSLQRAIEAGDPSLANGIYDDSEMKWLCNKCPYVQKCTDLRKNDDDAIDAGAGAA
jgi:CRISPR/Cas system-associated exonuclease Cas4 (RecB family)